MNEYLFAYKEKSNLLNLVTNSVRKSNYRFGESLPKFVFLCGKSIDSTDVKKSNRFLSKEYFKKHGNNRTFSILAEELWKAVDLDLLTYENYLAEVCDVVIIFLESIGTAAELGAFSMADNLISKLIVVIDKKFEKDNSFINQGPVRKIIATVGNERIIYVSLDSVFSSIEFLGQLSAIVKQKKRVDINKNPNSIDISSYLLEIMDIVSLLGPIKKDEIVDLYKIIKGFNNFDFNIKTFKHHYSVQFLIDSGALICNENGYVYINKEFIPNNIVLFEISKNEFNTIRSKVMAKKYKYNVSNELLFGG